MSSRPADLYLSLHDDGPVAATVAPGRRVAALLFAVLLLVAVPLVWMSADAVATSGAKAALASHDDDEDSSGSGDGDGDTATDSDSATETSATGVATATRSQSATQTGRTGVSTKAATVRRTRTRRELAIWSRPNAWFLTTGTPTAAYPRDTPLS